MTAARSVRLAAHVHSTWSYDGSLSLAEIGRLFERRGYDGVLLSEHDRGWDEARWSDFKAACEAASSDRLALVPGMEYSDKDNVVHVLVWGCPEFLGAGLATDVLLSRLAECGGGVAVLAHPHRRGAHLTLSRELLASFAGIEVWNRKYDGVRPNQHAREMAAELGLTPFVGLDFHTKRQLFPMSLHLDVDPQSSIADAVEDSALLRRAECRAFGVPLPQVLSPAGRALLNGGERVRRAGGRAVRKLVRAEGPNSTGR